MAPHGTVWINPHWVLALPQSHADTHGHCTVMRRACPQDTLASPARLRRRVASRARASASGRPAPYPASPQGARGQEQRGAASAVSPAVVHVQAACHPPTYVQDPKP